AVCPLPPPAPLPIFGRGFDSPLERARASFAPRRCVGPARAGARQVDDAVQRAEPAAGLAHDLPQRVAPGRPRVAEDKRGAEPPRSEEHTSAPPVTVR